MTFKVKVLILKVISYLEKANISIRHGELELKYGRELPGDIYRYEKKNINEISSILNEKNNTGKKSLIYYVIGFRTLIPFLILS